MLPAAGSPHRRAWAISPHLRRSWAGACSRLHWRVKVRGLAAAWRWERLGGLVAIGGYLLKQATLAVDGGVPFLVLWFDVWLWPALAGLLHLVCWWRNHQGGGRLQRLSQLCAAGIGIQHT